MAKRECDGKKMTGDTVTLVLGSFQTVLDVRRAFFGFQALLKNI